MNAALGASAGGWPVGLENAWIEVFRAGDYGARGQWSERELDRIAATYNPRLHAAPVVLGHPAHDAPAYAWVKALRRAGNSLWAQLHQVEPGLEELLRAGRFRTRSVALYTHFPGTGGPYLRHVGFLGAQPPEVKALSPVRFLEAPAVSLEFQEDSMPESKSKVETFLDHLRSFFAAEPQAGLRRASRDAGPAQPAGADGTGQALALREQAFAERMAQLEQRLDRLAEEKRAAEQQLAERDTAQRRQQIETFVETLRGRGKFPPVFERLGVRAFLEALAEADALRASGTEHRAPATEAGETLREETPSVAMSSLSTAVSTPSGTLLGWFQEFLTRLPAVIDFRELAAETTLRGSEGRVVRFTEPQRGVVIDPASVELAERAHALAAELGIGYADALARLREEQRAAHTSA